MQQSLSYVPLKNYILEALSIGIVIRICQLEKASLEK